MQHPKDIYMVGPCALSSVPLGKRRWSAAVAPDHAFRLHFGVLASFVKQKGYCMGEEGLADTGFSLASALCSFS